MDLVKQLYKSQAKLLTSIILVMKYSWLKYSNFSSYSLHKQGRQLWVGSVGNCPPRFWQNRRCRWAAMAHRITTCPSSFRKLLTSLINIWIKPKKCNLVSAYPKEIRASKSSIISKLVFIWKVATRYFYENRVFAPFPLREFQFKFVGVYPGITNIHTLICFEIFWQEPILLQV